MRRCATGAVVFKPALLAPAARSLFFLIQMIPSFAQTPEGRALVERITSFRNQAVCGPVLL